MRNFVLATKGSGLTHAQLLTGTGFTTHGRIVQVVPEKSRRPGMPRTQVLAKTSVMPSRRAGLSACAMGAPGWSASRTQKSCRSLEARAAGIWVLACPACEQEWAGKEIPAWVCIAPLSARRPR